MWKVAQKNIPKPFMCNCIFAVGIDYAINSITDFGQFRLILQKL